MKPSLVIFGLGNPGKEYQDTRHNAGFRAIEFLAKEYGTGEWQPKQKFLADFCEARVVTAPVLLVKPSTFMNRSGECVRKVVDFYELDPSQQIIVLCDEIDLDPGVIRYRASGSAGTHNGLRSIVDQFGEKFPRIRIGVGKQPTGFDLAAYVLSCPGENDANRIQEAIVTIPEIIRKYIHDDGLLESGDIA